MIKGMPKQAQCVHKSVDLFTQELCANLILLTGIRVGGRPMLGMRQAYAVEIQC
jgi:hypothetical protein